MHQRYVALPGALSLQPLYPETYAFASESVHNRTAYTWGDCRPGPDQTSLMKRERQHLKTNLSFRGPPRNLNVPFPSVCLQWTGSPLVWLGERLCGSLGTRNCHRGRVTSTRRAGHGGPCPTVRIHSSFVQHADPAVWAFQHDRLGLPAGLLQLTHGRSVEHHRSR
jgi:hypothetical protein